MNNFNTVKVEYATSIKIACVLLRDPSIKYNMCSFHRNTGFSKLESKSELLVEQIGMLTQAEGKINPGQPIKKNDQHSRQKQNKNRVQNI